MASASAADPLHSVAAGLFRAAGRSQTAGRATAEGSLDYRERLLLKPDAAGKPLWVCPDGRILLESSSPVYKEACDFLVAIAEPVCRTRFLQEYQLTPYSLYAGASMGLLTADILSALQRFSKARVPEEVEEMVRTCTSRFGKVKLVLHKSQYLIECPGQPDVLEQLLQDPVLAAARVLPERAGPAAAGEPQGAGEAAAAAAAVAATADALRADAFRGAAALATEEEAEAAEGEAAASLHQFEVAASHIKQVKERCSDLDWPLLEEYDFRGDHEAHELPIELKPETKIRDYQERSLSRMFSNHRARSGIIVLPCGAGKTLVGIVAACTVKRSCLVLCNSSVSVEQWYNQFLMWTRIPKERIAKFTQGHKEVPHKEACVLVATYNMITHAGPRAADTKAVMADIEAREWGLLLLDEVHVVPAATFLTCTTRTKSRCKLGLTATLVREDEKIDDLNFLIGPKLYEANWLDLQARGYIATVSCAEVWCPMTAEFFTEYLRKEPMMQRLLYAMNPNKFRSCEYLMNFHEARGDKVIVFSDNVFALKKYATRLKRPFIYGPTGQNERIRILEAFKTDTRYNTVFISKVGDTSIDLPDANVIIQISSHFGARRQEAQRLGRILRPKTRAGDASGFNAFFYTLVSRDTQEMFYSTKRQQFLVDQGYAFKVIPSLTDMDAAQGLAYQTKEEQLQLLREVLTANIDAVRADEDQDAAMVRESGGSTDERPAFSRKRANMSELSGGAGVVYAERPRAAGGRGGAATATGERNALFRKRDAEKRARQKAAAAEATT